MRDFNLQAELAADEADFLQLAESEFGACYCHNNHSITDIRAAIEADNLQLFAHSGWESESGSTSYNYSIFTRGGKSCYIGKVKVHLWTITSNGSPLYCYKVWHRHGKAAIDGKDIYRATGRVGNNADKSQAMADAIAAAREYAEVCDRLFSVIVH